MEDVRGDRSIGKTDELGLGITEDPIHVHDLQAAMLHALRAARRYPQAQPRTTRPRIPSLQAAMGLLEGLRLTDVGGM